MNYMFSYGINTNDREMQGRCPSAELVGTAWILGHGFRWRRYADIDPDEDSYVMGLLWMVSDEDLAVLDYFEGVPTHYTREMVAIHSASGIRDGWVYKMARKGEETPPPEHYLDAVMDGYRTNGIGDQQLISALRRIGYEPVP